MKYFSCWTTHLSTCLYVPSMPCFSSLKVKERGVGTWDTLTSHIFFMKQRKLWNWKTEAVYRRHSPEQSSAHILLIRNKGCLDSTKPRPFQWLRGNGPWQMHAQFRQPPVLHLEVPEVLLLTLSISLHSGFRSDSSSESPPGRALEARPRTCFLQLFCLPIHCQAIMSGAVCLPAFPIFIQYFKEGNFQQGTWKFSSLGKTWVFTYISKY